MRKWYVRLVRKVALVVLRGLREEAEGAIADTLVVRLNLPEPLARKVAEIALDTLEDALEEV